MNNWKDFLDNAYENNQHIMCLELPILKILIENIGWVNRADIIKKLDKYGVFKRGELSFDHLWSQRFGKGEESDTLNQLVEHDAEKNGDKKTKYKIKDNIREELKIFLDNYDADIESLVSNRLIYVGKNNKKFNLICKCLDLGIEKSNGKLKLKTSIGTEINLLKKNNNYRVVFNSKKGTYESITLDNLYKFLFENWRGAPELAKDDNRITLFEAIKEYVANNCKYEKENDLDANREDEKSAMKIAVLTHDPKGKWGDVRDQIENDNGRKGWNKSLKLQVGQCVLLYISGTIRRYEYLMKVENVSEKSIDLVLLKKLDEQIAEKLTYEKLVDNGFKPSTINHYLDTNNQLYSYVTSILHDDLISLCGIEIKNMTDKCNNDMLNQILYGPPGTGKTYNTINKALEIILPLSKEYNTKSNLEKENELIEAAKLIYESNKGKIILKKENDNRELLKQVFEFYKEQGQIEFVTFHQSYGYEEFVEGIKPCGLNNDCTNENSNIQYKVEDGIFKKLCQEASKKNEFVEDINSIDFNDYLTIGQNFETKHGKKFTITEINEDISFEQGNGPHNALRKTILEVLSDEKVMLNDEYYSSQVYIAREIYKQLKKKESVARNYVLIIDEINRGNISKIFGELITLIEDTKRIGKDEELKITLPYSGKEFGVPSNLYIIGTMNTADRSIALMDTALRRRFEFVEKMPDGEKLKEIKLTDHPEIDIKKIFEVINQRIEYLYDRDHTIGHSYLMNITNFAGLENAFNNKIIPLLQEYFYDDWEKIRLVLADNQITNEDYQFIIEKKNIDAKKLFGEKTIPDNINFDEEKKVYKFNTNAFVSPWSYIKIYDSNNIQKNDDNVSAEKKNKSEEK